MPSVQPDIEAEIYFLTPEEGGRSIPAYSGYRPQFFCDGHHYDATQNYVGVSKVYPGQTVKTELTFASPQYQLGKLYPGKAFLVYEGPRVIARGQVTKVLNLERSAQEALDRDAKRHP